MTSFRTLLSVAFFLTAIALWSQAERGVFEARVLLSGAEPLADESEARDHLAGSPPPFFVKSGGPFWSQLGYDVLVDGAGRVVAAHRRFGGEELKPWDRWRADRLILRHRFTPFLDEEGKPVPKRFEWSINTRSPEKLPTRTVAFPPGDRRMAEVTLVRTGCFGSCPAYWVSIRGDGKVQYCGVSYVKESGLRTATISAGEAAALIERFEEANFLALDDAYRAEVTDNPAYVLIFRMGDVEKEVVDYVGEQAGMPHIVSELQDEVDRVSGSRRWIGARDERPDELFDGNWEARHEACFGPLPQLPRG